MCDVGGEISSEFAPCAFERSPPHLFLYLLLFNKRKKRWKQARTLPVANTGESKILLNRYLKSLILFLFFYFFIFLCVFFYHGKLGVTGNLAGWEHDMRMHEL